MNAKKVLILDGSSHHAISKEHADFLEFLQNHLNGKGNYQCHVADIQTTALSVISGQPKVWVDLETDILSYDLVIFRNASRFSALAAPVCLYLAHHKVPYTNGMEGPGFYIGKIAQMFLFALNGLPVPDSLVVRNPEALVSFLPRFSDGRLIVKDNNGLRGRHNFLVQPGYDLRAFLESQEKIYIVQPYIPNNGDYRILYMGYERKPLIFKRTGAPGSHLNNTSQGGTAELIDDFPEAAIDTARAAAKLFGRELAGVDILFDEHGKHFILEVNETPAIASGFMPEAKLDLLDGYIQERLRIE